MPLINHGIQDALRKAGIVKDPNEGPSNIQSKMNEAGMSVDELLISLRDTVEGADSSSVKLRAIDTALKLHGVLKDQVAPPPLVNIIIADPNPLKAEGGLNPILIPRKVIAISGAA